jgi:hypothetical protein
MTWPGGVPDGETCFILISFTNTDATPALSVVGSDLGTTRQSSGADWHTEFYGTTFSSSPETLSIDFSVSTDYIVTLFHGGALSGFNFATLQANGSSTSAANAGGTVLPDPDTATACLFVAHRKGTNTAWTEPAGYTDNGESNSFNYEAHQAFLIGPSVGATGAVTATMGTAAKSATVLIAAK